MGNSELTWWPVEADREIARDGAGLLCREHDGAPLDTVPDDVLRTRRYPAWVLVNRPEQADLAIAADAETAVARTLKPHDLTLRVERIGRRLPAAHRPVYFEHAARILARLGEQKRAGTMFALAREAESAEQLPIDDEVWLAVHREFAALGALSTKAAAEFVRGLKSRAEPGVALDNLTRVAVLRTLAGQAPWPQLPKQLSAFAKAAGRDEIAVHREVLEQIRGSRAALQEAAAALWTAWEPALVEVCAQSPEIRELLLNLLPIPEAMDGWWLELLASCGATAGLVGAAEPGVEPRDGRAQWLSRRIHHPFLNRVMKRRDRVRRPQTPQLNALIVRMAPALRADGEPVRLDGPDYWGRCVDVRLLETCLAHGVPVADFGRNAFPDLDLWWRNRRPEDDLAAVVADPRFEPAVQQWAAKGDAAQLWSVPALRRYLTPPPASEAEPHPLDGRLVLGAVQEFGSDVGYSAVTPTRPLATIGKVSRDLRAGTGVDAADLHRLGIGVMLAGRLEWTVLRAVSPASSASRRELLAALLEVWGESAFADPDIRTLLTTAGVLEKFPGVAANSVGWATSDRLHQLLALLREHGPVPRDPAAAAALAAGAGLSRHAADLALAGLLGVTGYRPPLMSTEERKVLALSSKLLEDGRAELSSIDGEQRLDLFTGVLPDDPAELWAPGGMVAVAEKLAANWTARFGRKPAIPEATVVGAPDFGSAVTAQEMCVLLAEPAASPILTRDVDCWLAPGTRGGAAYCATSVRRVWSFGHWLPMLVLATNWAYAGLPAGDPVRAGIPEALRLARQRLEYPGLLLDAGWAPHRKLTVDDFAERFGPKAYDGPVPLEDTTFDDGLTVAAWHGDGNHVYFRPALYGRDGRTATLKASVTDSWQTIATLDYLAGPVCARMVERIESGVLPEGTYESDPRASVPEIVAALAGHLGLDAGAATLYLQLLAIPDPTDALVRTWNRWRPAEHKAAVAMLLEHGLVVEDKRPKAGRRVFLPGPKQDSGFGKVRRSVETWKADLVRPLGMDPWSWAPWPGILRTDLFAAAWDRVRSGDMPG